MQRYTAPDLLIIDDLGLRPMRDQEPLDVYDILRGRNERSSTIITSNRAIEEWYPLFGDPLLASARDGSVPPPRPRGGDGGPVLPHEGRRGRRR